MGGYYKEMDILMIRTGVNESEEATMACFFEGLNEDEQEKMKSKEYENLQDHVHHAVRFEQRIL